MFASVRALLSGIIDYAGMFPPAKLPLDQAIRNYARYRTEPESWMLGRFICPAARLGELDPYLEDLFQVGPPLRISALGSSTRSTSDFLTAVRADLKIVADFHKRYAVEKLAAVECYEVRLPEEPVFSCATFPEITAVAGFDLDTWMMETLSPDRLDIFFEIPFNAGWEETVAGLAFVLFRAKETAIRKTSKRYYPLSGIKIRCGGLEALAIPSAKQVAGAITSCGDKRVPLKATAGLHHPIRHFDAGVQTVMHGFLNVFVAGVLTFANRLSEKEIQAIIEDQDPKSFVFDDDGLRWKTYRAKTAQIEAARREFITSFGSCSFDEPRDDLRALGLIE